MSYYPLNHSSRSECDLELNLLEGSLPADLKGHLFVVGPCGSVNHEWPPPRHWPDGSVCQEHGAPMLNGDGMLYRIDFNAKSSVKLKNRILKTADYHADHASRYGSEWYKKGLHFENLGLSRTHQDLGTRNQLNTALNLIRMEAGEPLMLSANFDAGRPHLVDPCTLEVISPIGKQREWLQALPDEMEQLFPLVYSTAHPSFDPHSREFFTICYQKSISNLIFGNSFDRKLMLSGKFLDRELEKFVDWVSGHKLAIPELANALRSFVPWLNQKHKEKHKKEFAEHYQLENSSLASSELRLMRWRGKRLNSWLVVDKEEGLPVSVGQTMHQSCITEDYIILCDCSLKFSMDLLQSLPFKDHDYWNDFLRKLTTGKILPQAPLFIINRHELNDEAEEVSARRLELPHETIHLAADYRNDKRIITLHASHNSAACGAEWVRPYDKRATDGKAMPEEYLGMMCTGALDIGLIGKHLIDVEKAEIIESSYLSEKGFEESPPENFERSHSWGLGLFSHKNMYRADAIEDQVRQVYYQFYGLDQNDMTAFIYELYKDYNLENRQFDSETMLELYRQGIPQCLARHNTQSMKLEDHYLFPAGTIMRSFDFMPAGKTKSEDPQMNGYLVCLSLEKHPDSEKTGSGYRRIIQIFDAAKLNAGPICKLGHPDLKWAFTIHSCSCEKISPLRHDYRISVKEDCEWVISKFPRQQKREEMKEFLEKAVYPRYEKEG